MFGCISDVFTGRHLGRRWQKNVRWLQWFEPGSVCMQDCHAIHWATAAPWALKKFLIKFIFGVFSLQ